jgi:hypothetical protein
MSALSQSPTGVAHCQAKSLFRQTPHDVEFVIRAHTRDVGHPIRQCKERRNRGDIPNIVIAKPVVGDGTEIRFRNAVRLVAHLHREVEHGSVARRDIRLAVVDGDLVCYLRVLRPNAQRGLNLLKYKKIFSEIAQNTNKNTNIVEGKFGPCQGLAMKKPDTDDGMLEVYEAGFKEGRRISLFDAIYHCCRHGLALPDWAAKAFTDGYKKIRDFEAASLDDAFGNARAATAPCRVFWKKPANPFVVRISTIVVSANLESTF